MPLGIIVFPEQQQLSVQVKACLVPVKIFGRIRIGLAEAGIIAGTENIPVAFDKINLSRFSKSGDLSHKYGIFRHFLYKTFKMSAPESDPPGCPDLAQ